MTIFIPELLVPPQQHPCRDERLIEFIVSADIAQKYPGKGDTKKQKADKKKFCDQDFAAVGTHSALLLYSQMLRDCRTYAVTK